jgi:hypothetical protein
MITTTITIEIEVEWCPAEPDVGIMNGYYEGGIDYKAIDWLGIDEKYSEEIQEALADADQPDPDRAYDELRDRALFVTNS